MTIHISEVLEEAAREVHPIDHGATHLEIMWCNRIAAAIRALADKYEGYRVIEPDVVIYKRIADNYRAKETR